MRISGFHSEFWKGERFREQLKVQISSKPHDMVGIHDRAEGFTAAVGVVLKWPCRILASIPEQEGTG